MPLIKTKIELHIQWFRVHFTINGRDHYIELRALNMYDADKKATKAIMRKNPKSIFSIDVIEAITKQERVA